MKVTVPDLNIVTRFCNPSSTGFLFAAHSEEIMALEFRGLAIMDPPGRGVRFAGYSTVSRNLSPVICEVTADALRILGNLPEGSIAELMGIFEIHKEDILKIASAKFDEGEYRPLITAKDFAALSA